MKRLNSTKFLKTSLLLMLMLLVSTVAPAKNKNEVSFYIDGGMFAMDIVVLSVEKQGNDYFILSRTPFHNIVEKTIELLIRTSTDEVVKLPGQKISESKFVSKENNRDIYAKFLVTPAQFEEIRSGIKRIRIAGAGVDKDFKKDKIGKKLYKLYLRAKDF